MKNYSTSKFMSTLSKSNPYNYSIALYKIIPNTTKYHLGYLTLKSFGIYYTLVN